HPRPLGKVEFRVLGEVDGESRRDFEQPLEMTVVPNPSGFHLFFGEVRRPERGSRGFPRRGTNGGFPQRGTNGAFLLGEGTYAVRVESEFYQLVERRDVLMPEPAAPYFCDLDPGYAYPFPHCSTLSGGRGPTLLRGCVFDRAGDGVEGVRVEAEPALSDYQTDETGQWVLVFPDSLPDGEIAVRYHGPDGAVSEITDVPLLQGRENSLAQTALRGWVLNGTGVALAGATIVVEGQPGDSRTGDDGSWFYYFDPTQSASEVNVTAVLDDGRQLVRPGVEVRHRATVVVPTFRFSQPMKEDRYA
ncbi:MAG: hypothetical protein GY856_30860, partial [bacterium]|nr:hypothetical protein [bacterium]